MDSPRQIGRAGDRRARPAWRRQGALVALAAAELRRAWLVRFGFLAAVAVALGYATAMLVLGSHDRPEALGTMVLAALGWVTWGAGFVAVGAAVDLATRDERRGLRALAVQRGHRDRDLERGRLLAAFWLVGRTVAWPGLTLAALAVLLSGSAAVAAGRLSLLVAVMIYALVVAVGLGALSRWSAILSPARGRWLLLGLVVGPHALRGTFPDVPSVPVGLEWVLSQLARLPGVAG